MNPFQRARKEAVLVRKRLLSELSNEAVPAKQVLEGVESELNIGIAQVSAFYPDLGGGTAVLHRDQQFIYVSDCVDNWGSDFCGLVAHEVGHFFLDAELAATKVSDLSAMLGSDGSPGNLKVEAYGARERQELQANVFSRELLLPRSVARKLAALRLSCNEVAQQLGIPLEFVRLQMLDALLLPEYEAAESALSTPSPDQHQAARASERAANVVAGPGTGKTTTLINRVKYLIDERKVDPSRILVLTFTNKAALDLVERLRSAGIDGAADIWAGTFHAFGLEFLRKYHNQFGLESDLHVADQLSSMTMMVDALPRISLNHFLRVQDPYVWLAPVMTAITRLKEELVTPEGYKQFVIANPSDDRELQTRRLDVAELFSLHENLLAERKSVDFVDLISKPAVALKEHRSRFKEIAGRFDFVLVDEYQDVTQAMVEMLRQIAHGKSIWVVGDVRQAIHHWRGASLKSLLKFEAEFRAHAGGEKIQRYPLSTNRRSSQEIVDLTQHVGKHHLLERKLPLDAVLSHRGTLGEKPQLVTCAEKRDVSAAISQSILALDQQGLHFGKQAVLSRGVADLESLTESLSVAGIPCIFVGELGKRQEIKQLLCFMQLLVERIPKALLGLRDLDGFKMSLQDITAIIDLSNRYPEYQRGGWLNLALPGVSLIGHDIVAKLRDLIGFFGRNSNPWDFVCSLLIDKNIVGPRADDDTVQAWVTRLALWQFAYSVRNGDGDMSSARLSSYLKRQKLRQRIGEAQVQRDLPPEAGALNGVRLLTVHGSKGLEFDAVHVAYVKADSYGAGKPNWSPEGILDIVPPEAIGSCLAEYEEEAAAERNNLLYVAVSRARKRLFLYQDTQFGDQNLAPQLKSASSLVEAVFLPASSTPVTHTQPRASFSPVSRLPFDSFDRYVRCPLHHWYVDVLGLKGESEIDVSVKARMAIMESLKSDASGDASATPQGIELSWSSRNLPLPEEDPSLWRDACLAYAQGLDRIAALKSQGGVFQQLATDLNGITIDMPWGFTVNECVKTQHTILRFSRQRATDLLTVLRPLTPSLPFQGAKKMSVCYVLSDKVDDVPEVKRIAQTKTFASTVKFLGGNNQPTAGYHCNRCDFLSICPSSSIS